MRYLPAVFIVGFVALFLYAIWGYNRPFAETQHLHSTEEQPRLFFIRDTEGRCWQIFGSGKSTNFTLMKPEACRTTVSRSE